VVEPFEIPRWWKRFRSLGYGLDCTACYWWAVSPEGKLYVYRELYKPNLTLTEAAEIILSMTPKDEIISYTVASPDLWNRRQDRGISGAEIMAHAGLKGLIPADNRRVPGWRALREALKPYDDLNSAPACRYSATATNLSAPSPLSSTTRTTRRMWQMSARTTVRRPFGTVSCPARRRRRARSNCTSAGAGGKGLHALW